MRARGALALALVGILAACTPCPAWASPPASVGVAPQSYAVPGQALAFSGQTAATPTTGPTTVFVALAQGASILASVTVSTQADGSFAGEIPVPAAVTATLAYQLIAAIGTAVGVAPVTVLSSAQATAQFFDVPAGYWAAAYIHELASSGIVTGFGNGTYGPDDPLTRAQFVKMLDLTLHLSPDGATPQFSDVRASAWYGPWVTAAASAGIVSGVSPTLFAPNASVSRQEAAVMLARALKLTNQGTLHFTDGWQIAPWAEAAVQAAVAAGYLSGFPDGTFQPTAAMTRAEAAKVLAVVLQHPLS